MWLLQHLPMAEGIHTRGTAMPPSPLPIPCCQRIPWCPAHSKVLISAETGKVLPAAGRSADQSSALAVKTGGNHCQEQPPQREAGAPSRQLPSLTLSVTSRKNSYHQWHMLHTATSSYSNQDQLQQHSPPEICRKILVPHRAPLYPQLASSLEGSSEL